MLDKPNCWNLCTYHENCTWFSFGIQINPDYGLHDCHLFDKCTIEPNPQFLSGQKECQYGHGNQETG